MEVAMYDGDGTAPPMETPGEVHVSHRELLPACWLVS